MPLTPLLSTKLIVLIATKVGGPPTKIQPHLSKRRRNAKSKVGMSRITGHESRITSHSPLNFSGSHCSLTIIGRGGKTGGIIPANKEVKMENSARMTPESAGTRKGDYEILGLLGAGGMGQVYKVRNIHSDRIEAMKV